MHLLMRTACSFLIALLFTPFVVAVPPLFAQDVTLV
jgi:hypothetical protein